MKIGITEIIVILAVVFLLFGGVKLTGIGKALGRSIREFRDEVKGGKAEAEAEAETAGTTGDDKKS